MQPSTDLSHDSSIPMGRTNKNSLALNNDQINPADHRKVETQIDVSNIHNIGNGDQSENIESTIINVEKLNINENEKETSDDNESESNQIVRTSCSLYPMGWITLLPIILSTLAWIFSLTRGMKNCLVEISLITAQLRH